MALRAGFVIVLGTEQEKAMSFSFRVFAQSLEDKKFDHHAAVYYLLEDRLKRAEQSGMVTPSHRPIGHSVPAIHQAAAAPAVRAAYPQKQPLSRKHAVDPTRGLVGKDFPQAMTLSAVQATPQFQAGLTVPQSAAAVALQPPNVMMPQSGDAQHDPALSRYLQLGRRHTITPAVAQAEHIASIRHALEKSDAVAPQTLMHPSLVRL